VGEGAERRLRSDAEGDAFPGRSAPGTGSPQRQPSPGPGRMPHPLPDFSEQDAAKVKRLLADERADLETQPGRDAPGRTRQLPALMPHAFLTAQRQAVSEAPLRSAAPWQGPAAEPSWHVLGNTVGLWLDQEGGVRSLVSVADHPSGGPAGETEAGPADAASSDAGLAGAAPPAEAVPAPAANPDPAIASVRDTFAIVKAAGDGAAAYFYGWLFARNPELRELFAPAMNEQQDRLFRALGRIVGSMTSPEEMAAYLTQLGRDHRKYSVQTEMYDAVGEALMATLRAYAGPAFIPAAEEAWAQAYQAVSSLMIAAADQDSLTAPPFWAAEVVSNDQRSPGISILTVAPDIPLPYEPGQHITVQTPRWPKVWRPYSVACRRREDGLMTFHVKAVPGGWVSNALVYHTAAGDEIVLGPALGTMTLPLASGRDLLCVAGGTGLSPIKAIIEQAIKESTACPRQIYLFYGARTRDELYDLPDLWHMADAYQGFQLTPVTSDDPAFDGMQGSVGRVAARYMPHRECEAYVAGPPAMVRETTRVLARSGLPRERIHWDDALLADGE
jgi:NAD(P)H-flavin reductase/hemoglobin-like flavoprotein